MNIRIMLYYP